MVKQNSICLTIGFFMCFYSAVCFEKLLRRQIAYLQQVVSQFIANCDKLRYNLL